MPLKKGLLFGFIFFTISLGYALNTHGQDFAFVVYGFALIGVLLLLCEYIRPKKTKVLIHHFKDKEGDLRLEIGVTEEGVFTGYATPSSTNSSTTRQASIRPDGSGFYEVKDSSAKPPDSVQ